MTIFTLFLAEAAGVYAFFPEFCTFLADGLGVYFFSLFLGVWGFLADGLGVCFFSLFLGVYVFLADFYALAFNDFLGVVCLVIFFSTGIYKMKYL